MKYVFTRDDSEYFKNVDYLVEADQFSALALWQEFHHDKNPTKPWIKNWHQNGGKAVAIGMIDERPIVVQIEYCLLNNKLVGFWDTSSQLVDYLMIEEWFKKFAPNIEECNASNFHYCLESIGVLNEFRDSRID